jgi:hypothetical protein
MISAIKKTLLAPLGVFTTAGFLAFVREVETATG